MQPCTSLRAFGKLCKTSHKEGSPAADKKHPMQISSSSNDFQKFTVCVRVLKHAERLCYWLREVCVHVCNGLKWRMPIVWHATCVLAHAHTQKSLLLQCTVLISSPSIPAPRLHPSCVQHGVPLPSFSLQRSWDLIKNSLSLTGPQGDPANG